MNKFFNPLVISFSSLYLIGLAFSLLSWPGASIMMLLGCVGIALGSIIYDGIMKRNLGRCALHLGFAAGLFTILSRLYYWDNSVIYAFVSILLFALGLYKAEEKHSKLACWVTALVVTIGVLLNAVPSCYIYQFIHYYVSDEQEIDEDNSYWIHNKYSFFLALNGDYDKALHYIDASYKCAERYSYSSFDMSKEVVLKKIEENRKCIEKRDLTNFDVHL